MEVAGLLIVHALGQGEIKNTRPVVVTGDVERYFLPIQRGETETGRDRPFLVEHRLDDVTVRTNDRAATAEKKVVRAAGKSAPERRIPWANP